MNTTFDGYVVDIPYEAHFFRDITPAHIESVLAFCGVSLPKRKEGEPLRYLELGYGQGMSLNIHAATCQGEFWGTDFNPDHCLAARTLADKSGVQCHILNDSFEEILTKSKNGTLPQFDIISLHGVWSWITEENREEILKIISSNLKVGGAVYVSYNCMPGWADFAPMRELLLYHAKTINAAKGSVSQVQEAYGFISQLEKSNALYFQRNSNATAKFKSLADKSVSYVAHEYLNESWYVPYFKDVASDFAKAKCHFVSSSRLLNQLRISVPAPIQEMLAGIDDVVLRETVRDFALNTQFRSDIFIKGTNYTTEEESQHRDKDMAFALCVPQETVTYEITVASGQLQLKEDVCKPLVEFIASNKYMPKSMDDIKEALPHLEAAAIREALCILFAANVLHPAKTMDKIQAEQRTMAKKLNAHICQTALAGANVFVLASPMLEGGVAVAPMEMFFLLATKEGAKNKTEKVTWVQNALQNLGKNLQKEGVELSEKESLAELQEVYENFEEHRFPFLQALCVEV